MKKFINIVSFLVVLFLPTTVLLAQEKPAGQVTLKMGTLAPEGSTWMDVIKNIHYVIEKRTQGRIKTVNYASGVMGDELDMVQKLHRGQLQMGAFTIQGMTAIAPEMSVLQLPFLFNSYDEVDFVREKFSARFEKFFEKRGFVLVAIVDQGFLQIFSNQPVRSPEDLSRQKVWAWAEEPVGNATLAALGIKPVPLGVPGVLSALQSGLIDAYLTSPLVSLAFQWFNRVKYVTFIDIRYDPSVYIVTRKAWDSLNPGDRKIFLETSKELLPGVFSAVREDQKRSLKAVRDFGITLITLTPEEKEAFKSRSRGVWNSLAGKLYPRALLDDIVETLAEYRGKVLKTSASH